MDIEVSCFKYDTKTMQVVMNESKTIDITLNKTLPEGVYRLEEAPNGVYVYGDNRLVYESNIYNGTMAVPYGVGVKTDEHSFIIPNIEVGYKKWGANNVDVSKYGAFSSNTVTAFSYKNGRAVSDTIYNAKLGTPAIDYCEGIGFNLNNGYLASVYEMQVIDENMDAIKSCIDKINDANIIRRMEYISGEYWSSIQATESTAWVCNFETGKQVAMRHINKTEEHLVMTLTEFA